MTNTFEIVGKISLPKESDKFKPYQTNEYDSGWNKSKLLFNVQSESNRHMLVTEGLYKADGTGVVYTFTKGETDPVTHEKKKGEKIQVPWKNRLKPEVIDNIAQFKRLVVDLEENGRRYKLKEALDKQDKGESVEAELKELGVTDLQKAYDESQAKRKEFIHEYDFTEFLYKLTQSDKYKDKKFKVTGEITYSYYNGTFNKTLVPKRLYLAAEDEKESSFGLISVFFNKEAVDENSYEETKKYYINAFAKNYDGQLKKEIAAPIQLVIDDTKENEKIQKFSEVMKRQFTVTDDSWKEFGVKVKLLDGAQVVELTDDMLNDFQRDMLEIGAMTKEDILRDLGGDVYGDRIQEMIICGSIRGYSKGRKDTVYIDSDFEAPVVEEQQSSAVDTSPEDDLFGDMSDLI
ncbi:hypothetical protein [Rossellomorea marisflavi]|uniref:hypothetical protein n=1 Tax=Rossellomorea marisflavi TaxID=189381 RepID=UPI003FA011F6